MRAIACLCVGAAMVLGASDARAETIRVEIGKLLFAPVEIKARVGDEIEWVNNDFVAHTATARDGRFDVMLEPGKSGRVMLETAGVIDYYCRFHPNMTGRVNVTEK
ncbi:MAG: cupredoxin family copper-binding protein [Aestuariivirgaceae bacterium]